MRNLAFFTLLLFLSFSCTHEVVSPEESVSDEAGTAFDDIEFDDIEDPFPGGGGGGGGGGGTATPINMGTRHSIFHDESGLIETVVFRYNVNNNSTRRSIISSYCQIPDDYVLVGGYAGTWSTHEGAFLTESRPGGSLKRWYASSKDHLRSDPHALTIFAVGMKIAGMTSAELRQHIKLYTSTPSPVTNHPTKNITVNSDQHLIGGGARINWSGSGNMLVYSYPEGSTWYAKGKDHIESCPASITTYAIGIDKSLPGFGNVKHKILKEDDDHGPYKQTIKVLHTNFTSTNPHYVHTCAGAYNGYYGTGRMIMGYGNPSNINGHLSTNFSVTTKDHITTSSGSIGARAIAIYLDQ